MADTAAVWERYERWNDAVAAVVYPLSAAGRPTYLDLDDDVLDSVRDAAEPTAGDPAGALVEVVRATLSFDVGAAPLLRTHLRHLDRWERGDMLDPPPTLALLAVLSLAAENMRHGDGVAANNFYGRLAQLFVVDERRTTWFIHAYRKHLGGRPVSERLWGSLNAWLERLEGNRGLATAFADAHAHVGLPLSQALVRATDREKFSDLFASYGLSPHSALPAPEMEELIAEWISRVPCPASNTLERMWKRERTARTKIVDVARITLDGWDGTSADGMAGASQARRQVDSIRVRARMRAFPIRQLEISLIVAAPADASAEALTLIGPDNDVVGAVDLVPTASGWLTLGDPSEIDVGSFLRGETLLRRQGQDVTLRRRPRSLIPLRWDDLLMAFVESERVNLGEDALLLARSDMATRVVEALRVVARPGFSQHDSMTGLPEGWTLFDGVQVLSSIPREEAQKQLVDLNVLQPVASSMVLLQGGMPLPGNIRKWSSSMAPELRVTAEAGVVLAAQLTCVRPLTSPTPGDRQISSDQPVLLWDLAKLDLPDGDYEIVITADGADLGRPEVVRLRSADSPAVVLSHDALPLAHAPSGASFGFNAQRSSDLRAFSGIPESGSPLVGQAPACTHAPSWYSARQLKPAPAAQRQLLCFPSPEDGSCMVTGRHYMLIETATSGQHSVAGVCKTCGLVKRYPTRGRKKRSAVSAGRGETGPQVNVLEMDDVKAPPSIDWSIGFDALCHLGRGPMSSFERIAMRMEPTGLFGDVFARRLEALGHIEVERSDRTLAPTAWEVVEPTLAGLDGNVAVFLGFRSERMLVAAEDAAWKAGIPVAVDKAVDAPPRICFETGDPYLVQCLTRAVEVATNRRLRYLPAAAEALAAVLPPLSQALRCLPVASVIGARSVERWDPITARFEAASDAGSPGAFRLKGFSRSYIYRRPDDIKTMQGVIGDARTVKFAAALDAELPLVGYDAEAEVLYVPLGADLPGLYGRAAVLASGRPPREDTNERLLAYRGVSPTLAGRLCDLLMS